MGANNALLLVDADARSLRVLEVSLKKAGFDVRTADTAAAALASALGEPPELIITESDLPDYDGFELVARIKADPRCEHVGVVFLSTAATPELKIKAINAGADDFLAKPVLVKDIVKRLRALIDARATQSLTRRERPGNLSGNLASMGVVDLLQVMESGKKSGIVHVSSDATKSGGYVTKGHDRGTMFFRDGDVIDAKLGDILGAEVVYRMLLWEDGVFEIEFKQVSRADTVETPTQTILLEGMRRVDEWSKYEAELPPMSTALTLDYAALGQALPVVPASTQPVLHLFDGRRTLFEVVNDAPMIDTEALTVIADLYERGVFAESKPASFMEQATDDVEEWLSQPAAPAAPPQVDLPSALGRAVIPSPHTASEILRAEDPLARSLEEAAGGASDRTAIPEPLPEPSIVLSRHTVPANKAVPLTQRPETQRAAPPADAPGPQRLRIQRVASVVEPAPHLDEGWEPVKTAPSARRPNGEDARVTVADEPLPNYVQPKRAGEETEAIDRAVQSALTEDVDRADTSVPVAAPAQPPSYVIAPAAPPPWPTSTPTPTPDAKDETTDPEIESPLSPVESNVGSAPGFATPARSEASAFFEKSVAGAPDDDFGWDDEESSWKRRLPGVALVVAAIAVVLALAMGGKSGEHGKTPEVVANKGQPTKAPTKRKEAQWPKTPENAVVIDGAEAPKPGATDPKAAPPADPAAAAAVALEKEKADAAAAAAKAPPPPPPEKPAAPKVDPAKSKSLADQANTALGAGKFNQARSLYRRAIGADPKNAEAHAGLALVYVELGRDGSAKGSAWRALKVDKGQARAHLVLAMVAVNTGDMERAKKGYQSYLRYAPNGKHANEVRSLLKNLP